MKIIKAEFKLYDQENDQADSDAHGKTGNINECEIFVSPQIPWRCFQIISKHGYIFILFWYFLQDLPMQLLAIEGLPLPAQ